MDIVKLYISYGSICVVTFLEKDHVLTQKAHFFHQKSNWKRQFFLASNRAGNVSLVATNQKYHQKYIVFLHSWRRPHVLLKIPRFVTINTAGKCPNISSENIWFGCLKHGGEMS